MRRLEGKVAIVTGGGGGIGGAVCRRFAAEGAGVAVFDVNSEAAGQVAEAITSAGGKALAVAADITDLAAVKAGVEETSESSGRVEHPRQQCRLGPVQAVP